MGQLNQRTIDPRLGFRERRFETSHIRESILSLLGKASKDNCFQTAFRLQKRRAKCLCKNLLNDSDDFDHSEPEELE